MGRGVGDDSCTATVTKAPKRKARATAGKAKKSAKRPSGADALLSSAKTYIDQIGVLADRAESRAKPQSIEQRLSARAAGLKGLTYDEDAQRRLIRAIKLLEENGSDAAREAARRGREMFILCHTGLAHKMVRRYMGSLENTDDDATFDILMQDARIGLNRAVDGYEEDMGANPATYAKNWMRAKIGEQIEAEGRAIRVKSKAYDALLKVRKAIKELDQIGTGLNGVTAADIAAKSGVDVEQVEELLPHVDKIASGGGMDAFGWIPAPRRYDPDRLTVDAATRKLLHDEVASMPPLEAKLISALYGLNGEEAEQKALFEGVYRDKRGQRFTSEGSVISAAKARKVKVTKVSQRDLNRKFKDGELSFEPWTDAAAELTMAPLPQNEAEMAEVFTRETGVPPTSGTIQEAKRIAEEKLAQSPRLRSLCPRYRGPNELENSGAARVDVARALVQLGKIDSSEAEKLIGRTRTAKGGKSALRIEAEKVGLVDEKLGRIDRDRLHGLLEPAEFHDPAASSMAEMAELMSAVPAA